MKGFPGIFILIVGFSTLITYGELSESRHNKKVPAYNLARCIGISNDVIGCIDYVYFKPVEVDVEDPAQDQSMPLV